MAHELYEKDNMVSAHVKPWHGLGIVLDHNPTPKEAQELANLTWTVRKEPIYYRMPAVEGMSRIKKVPANFAIVRDDDNSPLGIVGKDYKPFQNDSLFDFMETFCKATGAKMETAGSLRNGKIVWALSTAGTVEHVENDPIEQYFLFKNSFDGSTNLQICFTNVRVVCNNTLTAALRNAKNMWAIRHTSNLHEQVELAKQAFTGQKHNAQELGAIMRRMASMPVTGDELKNLVAEIVRGEAIDAEDVLEERANTELEKMINGLTRHQEKITDKILELHESGAGADIPGVRGTLYGVLNAFTEYADHYKTIRPGERSMEEARFESLMMGSAQAFKARAFNHLAEMAAD